MRYTTARFGETTSLLGKQSAALAPERAFTTVDQALETATITAHGYVNGQGPHLLTTTGTLPTTLDGVTDYYLHVVDANTISFHLTKSDALTDTSRVNLSSAGSGTHTINATVRMVLVKLPSLVLESLDSDECLEIPASATQNFSTYFWSTANITTQPTALTEYLYLMTSSASGHVAEGKILLGGHPDESALQRFQGAVTIDTLGGGTSGTTFPTGTPEQPVDNLADALTIRSNFNLPKALVVHGPIAAISANLSAFTITGTDPSTHTLTFLGSATLGDTTFTRVGIQGDLTGATSGLLGNECIVGSVGGTVTGLRGIFLTCLFRGTIIPSSANVLQMLSCFSDEAAGSIISFAGTAASTQVAAAQSIGTWRIASMTDAGHLLGWSLASGRVRLLSSIDGAGFVSLAGYGEVTDESTSISIYLDTVIRGSRIDEFVSNVIPFVASS